MNIMSQFVNNWSMNERKREWRVLKWERILSNESTFRFIVTKFIFVCCLVVKNWKKESDDVIEFDSENDDDANESKKKKNDIEKENSDAEIDNDAKNFSKKSSNDFWRTKERKDKNRSISWRQWWKSENKSWRREKIAWKFWSLTKTNVDNCVKKKNAEFARLIFCISIRISISSILSFKKL